MFLDVVLSVRIGRSFGELKLTLVLRMTAHGEWEVGRLKFLPLVIEKDLLYVVLARDFYEPPSLLNIDTVELAYDGTVSCAPIMAMMDWHLS